MSAYSFKHLLNPANVTSGIAEFALLAPATWFDVAGIKSPVAPFTAQGDEVIIKTAHTFLAGKGFMKFQLAPQKNDVTIKTKGDVGLHGQIQEAKIFVAGNYAELHETMKNLLNVPLIVLIKDANCAADLYMQLGCDCQFAWVMPEYTSGTTKDGAKGYTVTITYDGGPMFYQVAGGPTLLT